MKEDKWCIEENYKNKQRLTENTKINGIPATKNVYKK